MISRYTGALPRRVITVVVNLFLLLVACYFILPLLWLFISTTKNQNQLFSTGMFSFPSKWNLGTNLHYLFTLQNGIFVRWLFNSFLYAIVVSVLATLFSAAIGYALAKFEFRLKGVIYWIVLCSMMIPGSVTVIPVFILEKSLGMINTYQGVILPQLVNTFGAYYMLTFISESLPNELIEAARIDGASELRIFFRIALPVLRPGLITLLLISFTGAWNNFFLPLLILDNESEYSTIIGLNNWLSQLGQHALNLPWYSLLITGSVVSIIPMIIIFPFLRRYVSAGAISGSVKV
ncbi:MAG: carbohydrate ABC transporter permease [Alicyclobacillus sp.]|nr:carbohydrate ABC transporter permease [Alicyclobacillus sp.]